MVPKLTVRASIIVQVPPPELSDSGSERRTSPPVQSQALGRDAARKWHGGGGPGTGSCRVCPQTALCARRARARRLAVGRFRAWQQLCSAHFQTVPGSPRGSHGQPRSSQ